MEDTAKDATKKAEEEEEVEKVEKKPTTTLERRIKDRLDFRMQLHGHLDSDDWAASTVEELLDAVICASANYLRLRDSHATVETVLECVRDRLCAKYECQGTGDPAEFVLDLCLFVARSVSDVHV